MNTKNIFEIVRNELSKDIRTRIGLLSSRAKRYFPDSVKGLSLSQDTVDLLMRQFYMILSESKDQIWDNRTPDERVNEFTEAVIKELANRFGIIPKTVRKYIESGGIIENKPRGPSQKLGQEQKDEVINLVTQELEGKRPQNYRDVHRHFLDLNVDVSYYTARRRFIEWGGSIERVISAENLKSRDYVQANKKQFLKEVKALLDQKMDIIFLDESYVHEKHMAEFSLTIGDIHLEKPSGKGKRTVMFGGVGPGGWVGRTVNFRQDLSVRKSDDSHSAGSVLYWVANQNGDYHKNFNQEIFVSMFKKHILQKLRKPTIIIMDRAPYHVCFEDGTFFPSRAKKAELLEWLLQRTQDHNLEDEYHQMKKPELLEQVITQWELPSTLIEDLAAEKGHKVLFLPQYHPELNAIEYCWAFVKGFIRKHPATSMENLLNQQLPEAFSRLTSEMCLNICNHVLKLYKKGFEELQDDGSIITEEEENIIEASNYASDIDESGGNFLEITTFK